MCKPKVLLLLLTIGFIGHAQQKFIISGSVTSKKTGETISGATMRAGDAATLTNTYGFYSLTLPPGKTRMAISSVGMQSRLIDTFLNKNFTLNVSLEDLPGNLAEVVVMAALNNQGIKSPQMGMERLNTQEIKDIPMLFGERDIFKAVQLLPGIKSAGDGNAGFYVRGGAADQNLVLLDEAPVYNASHLLGFFSTFNADAIKDVTVYKGGMPAQYGGRLSSVLDIRMNDGNNQNLSASGGLGLISSKLNIEGPLQKDRSSFLISARRTYADLFLKLSNDPSVNKSALYFYDLNIKLNYRLGARDRLFLSGYFGSDKLGAEGLFSLKWGNGTRTVRWNHIFSNKLFSNTSLILSNYNDRVDVHSGAGAITLFSQISDWNLKQELQWYADNHHNVRIGANAIFHTMRPGEIAAKQGSGFNSQSFQKKYSLENAGWIADDWKLSLKLNLSYGLRVGVFSILRAGDSARTYLNPEPRLCASYAFNLSSSVKVSWVRNVQNLHLISNSTSSSPTDKWVANTATIQPEIADQVSVGWYRTLAHDYYEFTVESYFKYMQHQIDYRDGADVYASGPIEQQLLYGKGKAYGIELLFKKKLGRLTGWLAYTLSSTKIKIDGINNNKWYNARQDRTHDISIVTMFSLNKRWSFSANWIFYTGDAVSFPSGKYRVGQEVYFYYTARNAYRMPAYHRLDMAAILQLKNKKHWSSEMAFSLYNAYGRQNAYYIGFRENKDDPTKTEAVQTALFTYIPSISYNFKFK